MASVASDGSTLVVGVGTDLVDVGRLAAVIDRRPGIRTRLFTDAEIADAGQGTPRRQAASLAARFAAKEAVMKSLGSGVGQVGFLDIEITGGRGRAPGVALSGRAARRAEELEVVDVAVSMSHDAGLAAAMAVASRRCPCAPS
jgi:holo-[acyl-carrier protein] synthase